MSEHSLEEINSHVKKYLMVFGSLLVLTAVTVAISYWHLSFGPALILALTVATIKGSLVAFVFMHLSSDLCQSKLLKTTLVMTVIGLFLVLLLPIFTSCNSFAVKTVW